MDAPQLFDGTIPAGVDHWQCGELDHVEEYSHETLEDAVEEFLRHTQPSHWPDFLVAHALVTREVDSDYSQTTLEDILATLDDEYSNRKTEPTPAMEDAAVAFFKVIAEEYRPYWADEDASKTVHVNVSAWLDTHPDTRSAVVKAWGENAVADHLKQSNDRFRDAVSQVFTNVLGQS